MKAAGRAVTLVLLACLAATAPSGCGSGGRAPSAVRSLTVSDPRAPGLRVLAPSGAGPWPVVVALHGIDGSGQDMLELGRRLARAGLLVFAPTYHSDISTSGGLATATDDIVCAYAAIRQAAPGLGGDLTRPVTAVGWSLGAAFVVLGALGPSGDTATGRCPGALPRPGVVVAVSGCYYRFATTPVTWFDDLTGWTNKGATVRLVAGDDDRTCPASQTDRLAASLRAQDYRPGVVHLEAADHPAPIFHSERDGRWTVLGHDPAGDRTVAVVVDAVAAARRTTG